MLESVPKEAKIIQHAVTANNRPLAQEANLKRGNLTKSPGQVKPESWRKASKPLPTDEQVEGAIISLPSSNDKQQPEQVNDSRVKEAAARDIKRRDDKMPPLRKNLQLEGRAKAYKLLLGSE